MNYTILSATMSDLFPRDFQSFYRNADFNRHGIKLLVASEDTVGESALVDFSFSAVLY